jgi:hypothetical protein
MTGRSGRGRWERVLAARRQAAWRLVAIRYLFTRTPEAEISLAPGRQGLSGPSSTPLSDPRVFCRTARQQFGSVSVVRSSRR